MENASLTADERAFLLKLARNTIKRALEGVSQTFQDDWQVPARLQVPRATFVTLHTTNGALRGCIGSLQAHRPLVEDVRSNALAAAFKDPRFPELSSCEIPEIIIEVSVLSVPHTLEFMNGGDLLRKLRPRIDGVVLERGWHRATFLPQVWEQLPSPRDFLRNLCYKAGLPADAWRNSDVKISTYQVEEFTESE